MAQEHLQKNLRTWKENADDIFAAQPEDRRVYDAARIEKIKAMLAETPTGAEIIKWTKENGIDIKLDYQCEEAGAGGYYIPGSKTVCLNAHLPDERLVMALAHELRHAWQGEKGFCPTMYKDVHTYLKQFRFIEADAAAIEIQVTSEWVARHPDFKPDPFRQACLDLAEKQKQNAPEVLRGKETLWAGFCGFFTFGDRKNFYDGGSLYTAEIMNDIVEFDGKRAPTEYGAGKDHKLPPFDGVNVEDAAQFVKLGEGFNGKSNYLAGLPVDILGIEEFTGNLSSGNQKRFDAVREAESHAGTTQARPIPRMM
ncbi:MAG: hypothetical protein EA357_04990 [Micavibrio sp.]|nr:MAG: hypothetical protein EA357_04990 [Micavibrio sp.]